MNSRTYEAIEIPCKDNLAVTFLYKSLPGRLLLRLLVNPTVSKPFGALMTRPASRLYIKRFVKRNNINMKEYNEVKYKSFNDFFIRQIKEGARSFPYSKNDLAAPCDGKLTAYTITDDSVFHIKNSMYDVAGMLQDRSLADEFMGGICLIFRLEPDNYHRYYYIDDGEIVSWKRIDGVLHTVKPISNERYNVYAQNTREYTVMQTETYGKAIQMEVGALFVGRIINYETSGRVKRGNEKGMFEFGGSTVVMLFQKGQVTIDDSIYVNTQQNKETIVRLGDKIGEKA